MKFKIIESLESNLTDRFFKDSSWIDEIRDRLQYLNQKDLEIEYNEDPIVKLIIDHAHEYNTEDNDYEGIIRDFINFTDEFMFYINDEDKESFNELINENPFMETFFEIYNREWPDWDKIEESLQDKVQYGVHQFSTESIIYRGTEEECIKYIDERPKLWDDAEVYWMTPDDPHYLKEGIYSYQTWIKPIKGEKQPSKTLTYGSDIILTRSPYSKEVFGRDWKRHITKIIEWCIDNNPGLIRLTHDFRSSNFNDPNSDEAFIAAIEDKISRGEYLLKESLSDSHSGCRFDESINEGEDMKFKLVEAAESKICCICKKPFDGYGNNAEPVCSGSCCDECNMKEVIPARLRDLKKSKIDIIDESLTDFKNRLCEILTNSGFELSKYFASKTINSDQTLVFHPSINLKAYKLYVKDAAGEKIDEVEVRGYNLNTLASILNIYENNFIKYGSFEPNMNESLNEATRKANIYQKVDRLAEIFEKKGFLVATDYDLKSEMFYKLDRYGEESPLYYSIIVIGVTEEDLDIEALELADSYPAIYVYEKADKDKNNLPDTIYQVVNKSSDAYNVTDEKEAISYVLKWLNLENDTLTEDLEDYKITYYLSTATAERRPETIEDVENDWKEEVFAADSDYDACKYAFSIINDIAEEDLDEYLTDYDIKDVREFIEYCKEKDLGDGSTFVVKLEGPNGVIYDMGETKEDFIEQVKENDEMLAYYRSVLGIDESLNEGNSVSGKIPPALDSFLQDIAQMYGTIDYGDIMDHDYTEDDIRKLNNLRRRFITWAQYDEDDEEVKAKFNDIANKVAEILKAKNESKELNENVGTLELMLTKFNEVKPKIEEIIQSYHDEVDEQNDIWFDYPAEEDSDLRWEYEGQIKSLLIDLVETFSSDRNDAREYVDSFDDLMDIDAIQNDLKWVIDSIDHETQKYADNADRAREGLGDVEDQAWDDSWEEDIEEYEESLANHKEVRIAETLYKGNNVLEDYDDTEIIEDNDSEDDEYWENDIIANDFDDEI